MRKYVNGGWVELSRYKDLEYWADRTGNIHRDNGLPAVVSNHGYEEYWNHGVLERTTYVLKRSVQSKSCKETK